MIENNLQTKEITTNDNTFVKVEPLVMRRCGECDGNKPLDEFYKRSRNRGYENICKSCRRLKIELYRQKNLDKILQKGKAYRDQNKERCKERVKRSRDKKKDYYKALWKAYRDNHKPEHNEYCNRKVSELCDWHIKNLITRNKNGVRVLSNKDIPQELVDTKRMQLQLKKEAKNANKIIG
jgi:hypothetical protein